MIGSVHCPMQSRGEIIKFARLLNICICIALIFLLQGLHHMWLWISLMTQRDSLHTLSRKIQASNTRLSHRNMTGYKSTKIHSSPMNGYLYGLDTGNTSDYFSSSESQPQGYTSCPTTPLTNRRFDFDFSKTKQVKVLEVVWFKVIENHLENSFWLTNRQLFV